MIPTSRMRALSARAAYLREAGCEVIDLDTERRRASVLFAQQQAEERARRRAQRWLVAGLVVAVAALAARVAF